MTKLTLALLFAALSAPGMAMAQAAAQASPEPAVQSQVFDAWTVECMEGQPSTCRMFSSIAVTAPSGQRAVAAAIGLRSVPDSDEVQISFQLPLGVMLQPGVTLSAADGDLIVQLPFVVCTAQACEAGLVLEASQLQALLDAQASATAQYTLAGSQQARLDFSMSGFGEAMAEMRGSSAP